MILCKCKYCGKEEYVYPSRNRKFCSRKCYAKWRSENIRGNNHPMWSGGQIKRNCILCKREFSFDRGDTKRRNGKLEKKFCSVKCKSIWQRENNWFKGENNPNWKGGITPLNEEIRASHKNKMWIKSIFNRDDHTCQECGTRGGTLHAHHIKEFNKIIKENNIENFEDSLYCKSLWNINNGVTLCKECHYKLHRKSG